MSAQIQTAMQYIVEDEPPAGQHATTKLLRAVPKQDEVADMATSPASSGKPTAVAAGQGERRESSGRKFPFEEFASNLDPGAVKARYQVGPVDPTILFVGDLDDRHGPDLCVRAMPAILKNHPQARLVIVGDGPLLWPLRVMSRYMLLDHAIRIVGHVGGRDVRELIAAADIIVVPSRVQTEDWQILAGWSARRPVVATHDVAHALCRCEEDAVLIYPNPGSCVWGVERVLCDLDFGRRLGERGYEKVVNCLT